MSNISVPQLMASSAGLNTSGQMVFRQCQELGNMDPNSQDFQTKKAEIAQSLEESLSFVDTLRNLLV